MSDYQPFRLLDSGDFISKDYWKMSFHIDFDVKFDLTHMVIWQGWPLEEIRQLATKKM